MTFPTLTLPSRPVGVDRGVIAMPRAYYLSTPVLLAVVAFMLIAEGPGIWRDYQISENPVVVEDGDIRDGKCTTRKMIFTTCEATIGYTRDGQSYQSDVEVMFVDLHSGDYETEVVVSANNPSLATLSLGLEKMWNRIITLVAFAALLGGLCIMMIFLALRILVVWTKLRRPAVLTPVPVTLTAIETKNKRLVVTYADKVGDKKTGRSATTWFHRDQQPLIVGEAGDNLVALGVWHGSTALPILLDSRLERLDLTDEERRTALAPLDVELAALPPMQISDSDAQSTKKGMSFVKRLGIFFGVILFVLLGFVGYWLWYVTSAPSQFNSPGMDINNMMPAPINRWGCDQLKSRFGNDRAPFGCAASDYQSWK